jgi:hypothetical protein
MAKRKKGWKNFKFQTNRPAKRRRKTVRTSKYTVKPTLSNKGKHNKALDFRGYWDSKLHSPFPLMAIMKFRVRNSGSVVATAPASQAFQIQLGDPMTASPYPMPNADISIGGQRPTGFKSEFNTYKYNTFRVINATLNFKYIPSDVAGQNITWGIYPVFQGRVTGGAGVVVNEDMPYYKEKIFYPAVDNKWVRIRVPMYEIIGITEVQYMTDTTDNYAGIINGSNSYVSPPVASQCFFNIAYQTSDSASIQANGKWKFYVDYEVKFENLALNFMLTT